MQVGETGPANFVVSTVAEAELLAPYLRACQEGGRDASVSFFFFWGFWVWARGFQRG